ncbi:hypothetical protein [Undibacterium sp. TJN19]|uniref:hypothetical protein n=1 Tax=Undibacterium sp. TJN19 TaxID=3413055 RepID=UPI003BF46073
MHAHPWKRIFAFTIVFCFLLILGMEGSLRYLGYQPTALDSKERWGHERSRASKLGRQALILIDTSRFQLGLDLDVLRKQTGLEPLQLAIDGSSFVPILKGLADDARITGTVLIDYTDGAVLGARNSDFGNASMFEDEYEKSLLRPSSFSADTLETYLTRELHENLSIFSDGANPLHSLRYRIVPWKRSAQYINTLPDRSRLADYSRLAWPDVYFSRVAKQLGVQWDSHASHAVTEARFKDHINKLQVASQADFLRGAQVIQSYIARIENRGGKVMFVEMPTNGLVKDANQQIFPRRQFFDVFFEKTKLPVLSSQGTELQSFICPDGSHIDMKDRARLSAIIARFVQAGLAAKSP